MDLTTRNSLDKMIDSENHKINSLNEIEEVSYLYLKKILNEFNSFYIDHISKFANTSGVDCSKCLADFLGEHYKYEFDILDKGVINDAENNNSYDKLEKIYELIELIKNNNNIDSDKFFELCGIDTKHPLISSHENIKLEKREFLSEIVSNIKNWKKSGSSLLYSIEKFRMSPEGRKAITRNKRSNLDNEFLENFINSYAVSERAEIFVRIEKYIKSGWFDVDNPLQDYYSNKDTTDIAIYKLKNAMGERFFEAEIIKTQLGNYFDYELVLHEDKKLGDSVFKLAQSGVKDCCIKGTDGKIYLGDTTTDETGYMNGNSWITTLKAIDNYKKNNQNAKVEYSISLMALFYDGETKDSIKKKFSEKFDSFTLLDINDWHLMQFLAVLDRDSQDFGYDLRSLIKEVKLNIFGSSSEGYCNTVLNLDKDDFFEEVFYSINRILTNFNKKDNVFNAQGMRTNVESIPVHLLTATIKGMEKLINHNDNLILKYCELSEPVEALSEKIVNSGHINEELSKLYQRLGHPEDMKKLYLKGKDKYDKDKSEIIALKEERNQVIEKNGIYVKDVISSYTNMIENLYDSSKDLLKSQCYSWEANYTEAFDNLISGLKSYDNINNDYKSWINYNKITIDKRDKSYKELLFNVISTVSKSYGHDSLTFIDNIKTSIVDIEKFIENIPKLDNEFFKTKNNFNIAGYTMHGGFVYHQLKAVDDEHGEMIKNNYFNNMKESIETSLEDFKNKLDIFENNKLLIGKFKPSV